MQYAVQAIRKDLRSDAMDEWEKLNGTYLESEEANIGVEWKTAPLVK